MQADMQPFIALNNKKRRPRIRPEMSHDI